MIRMITQPEVYLVGKPQTDDQEIARFLASEDTTWTTDSSNAGELLPELGGRVCYMAFGKKQGRKTNKSYLNNIMDLEHGSVLEHNSYTFLLTGVSRVLTHELVRHRAGFSYSELSQRWYAADQLGFIVPWAMRGNVNSYNRYAAFCDLARHQYQDLVEELEPQFAHLPAKERNIAARQDARYILPGGCETKIQVTANARAWQHFITMRASQYALPEIRQVAIMILRQLQTEAPNLFGRFIITRQEDGSEIAVWQ